MRAVHIGLVLVAAGASTFSAVADFLRLERIRVNMTRAGVPTRFLPWLGVPKALAVAGLLAGLVVPWLAVAAAGGLVLFFLLAIGTHLRAGGPHDRVAARLPRPRGGGGGYGTGVISVPSARNCSRLR